MPETKIIKKGWICCRCKHEWIPKEGFNQEKRPMTCPKCRSAYWNIPKKVKK